jgi:hypothetical protein
MRERRVTGAAVGRIAEGLSDRDRGILADVARVRVLTGKQVERLHFAELEGAHRDRTRRRVLERLVALQLLTPLERRIGGVRAGSAGLVYALGPAGQRLHELTEDGARGRIRRPGTPTARFMIHNLAVAELYVGLVEAARSGALALVDYRAEPACWWRDSDGEWIKPDAYAVVNASDLEDSYAIEVDQATESVPTLRRKFMTYVNLAAGDESGPAGGPLPRVLVTVPDERRLAAVGELLRTLPEPAEHLFTAVENDRACKLIQEMLEQ